MAEQGKDGIAWTEQTWNPIRGCRRKNKDCINCYAEHVAARFSGPGKAYEGLVDDKGRWNGEILFVEKRLLDPLRWERPRLIFTNSMSDLFFEERQTIRVTPRLRNESGIEGNADPLIMAPYVLPTEEIDQIVAVMWLAHWHTYQVLTKRPQRMLEYLTDPETPRRVYEAAQAILAELPKGTQRKVLGFLERFSAGRTVWPLPNVWWGASMGHQDAVDEFLPLLYQIKQAKAAAVTWASIEPLIERVRLKLDEYGYESGGPQGWVSVPPIDWAVIGLESQAGARDGDVAWIRELLQELAPFDIAPFVKQLGAHPYDGLSVVTDKRKYLRLQDNTHGADPSEWAEDLRVRRYPAAIASLKRELGVTGMSLS